MAIGYVTANKYLTVGNSGSSTTHDNTLGATPTPGNLLVSFQQYNVNEAQTCADDGGVNSWSSPTVIFDPTFLVDGLAVSYTVAQATGTPTKVTWSSASAARRSSIIVELTNVNTSVLPDVYQNDSQLSGGDRDVGIVTTPLTTTGAGIIIVVGVSSAWLVAPANDTNFTVQSDSTPAGANRWALQDRITTGAVTSLTPVFPGSSNHFWMAQGIAFKEAGGGGGSGGIAWVRA